jgi:hypothetical protein
MMATLLKHRWILSIAVAASLGACSRDARLAPGDSPPSAPSSAPPAGPQYVGVVPPGSDVEDVIDDNDLIAQGWLPDSRTLLFQAPTGFDSGDFEAAGLNEETQTVKDENDIISFYEWDEVSDDFSGQPALACLDLLTVHATVTGTHSRVAVLDTGVDPNHPQLVNRVVLVNDPVLGTATLFGADPLGDAYAHGTHVTGVILNVAPGATVYPFKVLNEYGTGNVFDLVAGIDAAMDVNVDVINLSLSVSATSTVVEKAILRAWNAGVLIVAAAGNNRPGGTPVFPANHPAVIGVAATDGESCTDVASYSAWHATDVAFAAPGYVLGAHPLTKVGNHPISYSERGGTSTACAVVTGCLLLGMDAAPLFPPGFDPLVSLQNTAVPVAPAGSVLYGRVSPVDAFDF